MSDARPPKPVLYETAFIYLLNAAFAVFTTIAGAVLLPLTDEFDLALSQGSRFVTFQNAGCFFGILTVGFVVDRFSKRTLILVCYLLYALAIIAVRFSASMNGFLALLLLAGFFTKIIDALLNATISQLHPVGKGFYMNLLHSFYGIGSLVGPIYAGLVAERLGGGWRLAYFALGCFCLILAVFYGLLFMRRRKDAPAAAPVAAGPAPAFRDVFDRNTVVCMAILFFYCGHQIGMNNWFPTFMSETLGSDTVTAGFGLSAFWFGLIAGRLICSLLTRRCAERTLVGRGGAFGGALLLIALWPGGETGAFAGAALAGFFAGATIPLVITLAYSFHPGMQGKVSMFLFIAITLGGVVGPWLMGLIISSTGLPQSMILNAAMLFAVAGLSTLLPRSG